MKTKITKRDLSRVRNGVRIGHFVHILITKDGVLAEQNFCSGPFETRAEAKKWANSIKIEMQVTSEMPNRVTNELTFQD